MFVHFLCSIYREAHLTLNTPFKACLKAHRILLSVHDSQRTEYVLVHISLIIIHLDNDLHSFSESSLLMKILKL